VLINREQTLHASIDKKNNANNNANNNHEKQSSKFIGDQTRGALKGMVITPTGGYLPTCSGIGSKKLHTKAAETREGL
jgi:hypothetical protein